MITLTRGQWLSGFRYLLWCSWKSSDTCRIRINHVAEGTEFVVGKSIEAYSAGGLGQGFDEGTFAINGKELSGSKFQLTRS